MTQAETKAAIKELIEYLGGYAAVINVSGIPIKGKPDVYRKNPEMSGLGDVLACWEGLHLQFEVKKTEEEELRESQKDHKKRLERAGGQYHQVIDLEDVIDILRGLGAKVTL